MRRIPEEVAVTVRPLFMSLFGGPDRLDCWVTKSADEMASLGETLLPQGLVLPPPLQTTMALSPREVLDTLLAKLHDLKVWEYDLKREQGLIKVYDRASGHLLEEAAAALLPVIRAKYGDNLRED